MNKFMHEIYKLVIILSMIISISTITSCEDSDKMFKFETNIVDNKVIKIDESFSIYVKTTNISNEDYYYEGSSTLVGAIIYLKKDETIIRPQDIPVTKDFRKIVFKSKNSTLAPVSFLPYNLAGKTFVLFITKQSPGSK